jgi:hypothetical protein
MLLPDPRMGRVVAEHTLVALRRPHPIGGIYTVQGADGVSRALAWYDRSVVADSVEAAYVVAMERLGGLQADPRLPAVRAAGKVGEDPFLIYEPSDAPPLSSVRRLLPKRVAGIGTQIAGGLAAAAAVGVHHGALTPATVFLGKNDAVRIHDFGVRTLGDVESDDHPPWAYVAPEDAPAAPSEAGDVYALGVVLYELLVGENPFRALFDPVETRRRHTERMPPPPSKRVTRMPEGFEALLLSMLAKAPEDRPSAAEVEAGFGALAKGQGVPVWAPKTAPMVVVELEVPPEPEVVVAPVVEPERVAVPAPLALSSDPVEPELPTLARPAILQPEAEHAFAAPDTQEMAALVNTPAPPPPRATPPPMPAAPRPPKARRVSRQAEITPPEPVKQGVGRLIVLALGLVLLITTGFGVLGYVMLEPESAHAVEVVGKKAEEPTHDGVRRTDTVSPGMDLQAMINARSDQVLHLRGEHTVGLAIGHSVTLLGDPEAPATLVLDETLKITGGTVRLSHVNLVWIGAEGGAVSVEAGTVRFEHVDLRGGVGNGIRVSGGARLTLRDSDVHDVRERAVYVLGKAHLLMQDTRLSRSGRASLELTGHSSSEVLDCAITQSGGAGVFINEHATGRISGTEISESTLAGVEMAAQANVAIIDNRIFDGKAGGMLLRGADTPVLVARNQFKANKLAGIEVKNHAMPEVLLNTFTEGNGAALFIHSEAGGTYARNSITGHRLAGVELKNSRGVVLRDNHIKDGKSTGLYAHDGAEAAVFGGSIKNNGKAGGKIAKASRVDFHHTMVNGNQEAGLFFYESGMGDVIDCDLSNNRLAGVEVREKSAPHVRGTRIHHNKGHGIYVHTGGAGVYEGNTLGGNGGKPIQVKDNVRITQRNNNMAP